MDIQEMSFWELALELERAKSWLDTSMEQTRSAEREFLDINTEMNSRARALVDQGDLKPGVYDWSGTVFEVDRAGWVAVRIEKIRTVTELPGYEEWSKKIREKRSGVDSND